MCQIVHKLSEYTACDKLSQTVEATDEAELLIVTLVCWWISTTFRYK